MFNNKNPLKGIIINERVLSQLDYNTEELIIVTYLLLHYHSSIREHDWAKTIFTSCELILANTTRDIGDARRLRDKMINSIKSLEEKGLIKVEGTKEIYWNTTLKIEVENLINLNKGEGLYLDLNAYFKLATLRHKDFRICLQLYIILKSYIDSDEKFFGKASMIPRIKLTSSRYYGDYNKEEWIIAKTCKKALEKMKELGMIVEINPSLGELNLNLPYVYCMQENLAIVKEFLEDVVESFEVVRQARQQQGRKNCSTWSEKVRERDNHKCQICGETKDILHAHHLNAKSLFPEQSLDIDNGVTLCKKCHYSFHSLYGVGGNTREQYEEFKYNKFRTI